MVIKILNIDDVKKKKKILLIITILSYLLRFKRSKLNSHKKQMVGRHVKCTFCEIKRVKYTYTYYHTSGIGT